MSLADLRLWILKLFRLHPETQDLFIMGFFREYSTNILSDSFVDVFTYSESVEVEPIHLESHLEGMEWDTRYFSGDRCWTSFANKMKRKNMVQDFRLYVDCHQLQHYEALYKAARDHVLPTWTENLPTDDSHDNPSGPVQGPKLTPEEFSVYLDGWHNKNISLPEAWRTKQEALEKKFGTFYSSYNSVPRLLQEIEHIPGGFVHIQDSEVAGCEDFRVLHRIFWAFGHCIQAFRYCRPVLCVKSAPLCGKYQGVLLTALALDANDCLVPVAFAVAESETKDSWLWFLRNVKQAVVKERSGVCIIHDCKAELVDAVDGIQNDPEEPHPWRDVKSRWCMQHLAQNFLASFGDKKLMALFKRLCQQKQASKFAKIWKELDESTLKCVSEKNGDEAELREDGDHGVDSPRKITKFSDWIRLKPKEKWSLLHDTSSARYGIMGTDMSDVYTHSHVLKGILCLPLGAIVEVTFKRMAEYFNNTSAAANEAIKNPAIEFPQRVQDDMNLKMQKAHKHQVTICMNPKNKNVILGGDVVKYEVKTGQKSVTVHLYSKSNGIMKKSGGCTLRKSAACSCNKLRLLRRPCSHVMAVCCQIGVSTSTYISPYYSLPYLGNTWRGKFVLPEHLRKYRAINQFWYESSYKSKMTTWIPDKKLECGLPVFLTSDSAQTGTDVEEQEQIIDSGAIPDHQGTKKH
jgi:hypothetical protein